MSNKTINLKKHFLLIIVGVIFLGGILFAVQNIKHHEQS